MKIQDAVTGQHELADDLNVLPSVAEGNELIRVSDTRVSGPDVVGLQARPEWYGYTYKAGGGDEMGVVGFILDGDNLDGHMANGKGTYVHQPVVGGGEIRFVIEGSEVTTPSIPGKTA